MARLTETTKILDLSACPAVTFRQLQTVNDTVELTFRQGDTTESPDRETGWRAGEPGPQIIRITFSGPTNIRHIHLFSENCSSQGPSNLRCGVALQEGNGEVIRQHWAFRSAGIDRRVQDYRVTLDDVVVLELAIVPDINNGGVHASLLRLRIG